MLFKKKQKQRRSTPIPLTNSSTESTATCKPSEHPERGNSIGDLKTIKYVPPEGKRERSFSLGTDIKQDISKATSHIDEQSVVQYRQYLEYQKMQMMNIFNFLHSHNMNISFDPNQNLQSIYSEIQNSNQNSNFHTENRNF